MIKVNRIEPQTVECFDNNHKSLGFLNEYEFNDLRCQIAENKVNGYYIRFKNEAYVINSNGKLVNWPNGLFDTMETQLARLFIAQRV